MKPLLLLLAACALAGCGERKPAPHADPAQALTAPAPPAPAASGAATATSAHTGPTADTTDTAAAAAPDSTLTPAEVIRRYYAAIDAKDYQRAYGLWGSGGAASGQSFEQFRAGFAKTAGVEVEIGAVGRVEGAAGSRYVEVPVVIRARTTAGTTQRFAGSYTLRRTVVDGSTAAQRRWHIYSAKLTPVLPSPPAPTPGRP